MKRVTIAVALFLSMLFGSSAFAGGMSSNAKYDANFVSVGGYYQRGRSHYNMPYRWKQPRRQMRVPRNIYRQTPSRQAFKYTPRRQRGYAQPRMNRIFKRSMPRSRAWYNQQWRQKQRGMKH